MNNLKGKTSVGFNLFFLDFVDKNVIDDKNSTFEEIRIMANAAWNSQTKERREQFKNDSNIIGHDIIQEKLDKIIEHFKAIQLLENQKRADAARKIKYFLEDSFDLFNWNSQVFIFAHVNYQVKVKKDFYPIELGLVKYSFDDGLLDTLYVHLNSSPLPVGNENLARVLSEDTHQLPVNANFGESYSDAKVKIAKFMENEKPFVFVVNEKDDIAATRYTFGKIFDGEIYVGSLDNLLLRAYEALYKKDFPKDPTDILINHNPWESYDIGCDYHKDLAASKFCSLAKAKRWAFHISKILLPKELLYPFKHTIC